MYKGNGLAVSRAIFTTNQMEANSRRDYAELVQLQTLVFIANFFSCKEFGYSVCALINTPLITYFMSPGMSVTNIDTIDLIPISLQQQSVRIKTAIKSLKHTYRLRYIC